MSRTQSSFLLKGVTRTPEGHFFLLRGGIVYTVEGEYCKQSLPWEKEGQLGVRDGGCVHQVTTGPEVQDVG